MTSKNEKTTHIPDPENIVGAGMGGIAVGIFGSLIVPGLAPHLPEVGALTGALAMVVTAGVETNLMFKSRNIDLGAWWKNLTSRDQKQLTNDKVMQEVAGVARKAAVLIDHVASRPSAATREDYARLREEVTFFAPFVGAGFRVVESSEKRAELEERMSEGLRLEMKIEQDISQIDASTVTWQYFDGDELVSEGSSIASALPEDVKFLFDKYVGDKEQHDFEQRVLAKEEAGADNSSAPAFA